MSADPARKALELALDDAVERVARATGQILRPMSAGVRWHDERIARAREELRRALSDRAIANELIAELDEIDAMGAAL